MSHLENIAERQRKSLFRDALFVALLAFATLVSVAPFTNAIVASASAVVASH
jgi:hypothetical protein